MLDTTATGCRNRAYGGGGLLLKYNVNVNTNFYEMTALALAAENGYEAVVRLLLEHRADVDAKYIDGMTALALAAKNGHETVVWLLESRRATPPPYLPPVG